MDELEQLVSEVLRSPKYRTVSTDLVANVGARELAARGSLREAIKATKNKLHQVGGAYFAAAMRYREWLAALDEAAHAADRTAWLQACAHVLEQQSSTRERLGILDQFYETALAGLPPGGRVLDIACGLNPVAIPWMRLPEDVEYLAYDIYGDMVEFLQQFLHIAGVRGQAELRDVLQTPPDHCADVALVLKSLPCLEQLDRTAGARLIEVLRAKYVVVSFPVRSLGGRSKRMSQNYEEHFWELLRGKPWPVQRFQFATELVFVIQKTTGFSL